MIALLCAAALAPALGQEGTVTLPLAEFEARSRAAEGPPAAPAEPAVVRLGAARYRGVADEASTLDLRLELQVSLSGSGVKEVPLLGPDVVIRGASVGGVPVAVSRSGDRPVWRTERTGDLVVVVDALVPPSGQRGSLEYDFGVVPTPITTLDLTFPRPDVRPRVERAVRTDVTATGSTSRVVADLERTDRIVLLGLRELGSAASSEARLYAETTHLLAVDEHELELFTVVRYDILYATASRFDVFVPEGLKVVSADGEGAFTYEVVPAPGGVVVQGETGTPMRNRYELSLELARELPDSATRFALPSARGVERENGWVGVEAPGRVRLDPITELEGLQPVPIAQLPDELRSASVSPLLEGFRLGGPAASLELKAHPLPEVEARTERIDRVVARSVVSSNGRVMTELALTLRNRMRPGLGVELPEGATLVRALRDGQIVTPSQASTGEIVVPLRRSGPDLPFTVQLVVAQDLGSLWSVDRASVALPALDWPIAEVAWEVEWPDGGHWLDVSADVPDQALAGYGQWLADAARDPGPSAPTAQVALTGGPDASYHRYWVPAGERLELRALRVPWAPVMVARVAPYVLFLAAVPLALGVLAVRGWQVLRRVRPAAVARPPSVSPTPAVDPPASPSP